MGYPSIDLELPCRELCRPILYEIVDGCWRATQVTHLGRCVADGDTLQAATEAVEELIRLQLTEDCQEAEARDLIRTTA